MRRLVADIRQAIAHMLDRQAPYLGLDLDRHWNAVKLNTPANILFSLLKLAEGGCFLDLVTNPIVQGVIGNWPEVAHHTMQWLRAESLAAGGLPRLDAAASLLSDVAENAQLASNAPKVPTI